MATLVEGSLVKLARTFEEHGRGPDWVQALNSSGVGADLAECCSDPHKVDRQSLRRVLAGERPSLSEFSVDSTLLTPVEGALIQIPALRGGKANSFATKDEDPRSPFGYRDLGNFTFPNPKKVRAISARAYRLVKPATFSELRDAVGGEEVIREKHFFTARQIRFLVDKQADGREGPLLNNGWANLFFTLTSEGSLAVVRVDWDSVFPCWFVWATPVSRLGRRGVGDQLFLRT